MTSSDGARPLLDEVGEPDEEAGRPRIRARRLVPDDEPFFAGHFPGMPVVPGVFVLEALAGCSRRLLPARAPGADRGWMLVAAPAVRFRRRVIPGDTLELAAVRIGGGPSRPRFRTQASVGGHRAVEATLEFA